MTTSGAPSPTVVVVAYQSGAYLAGCLTTLDRHGSVVVVDNEASLATRELVEGHGARYLAADRNLGFAAAVNRALDAAWDGRNDVLLLNPDARISTGDLVVLQGALHAPGRRLAAVGPRLVSGDGRAQRAAWPLPSPGQVWFDAFGLTRYWRGPQFVVGAVLLLAGEAIADIGGLDERYFLYAEEADWQVRALRAGWAVAVIGEVTAVHAGGASSSDADRRNALFHSSGEAFARRWYGRWGWTVIRLGALVASGRRSLVGSAEQRRLNRRTFVLYLRGPARAAEGRFT